MACSPAELIVNPVGCAVTGAGGAAVSGAVNSGMAAVAQAMADMFGKVIKLLFTSWMGIGPPDLSGTASVVRTIQTWTMPLAAVALIIGLIVAGVKLAWRARFEDDGKAVLKGIILTVVITGAGGLLVGTAALACDEMGNSILTHGFNGRSIGEQAIALAGTGGGLGLGLESVMFFFAGIATLAQGALMLLRGPIFVLLVGVWPSTAAAAVTGQGSEWFKRITAWLVSWVLYKLVAGLIYGDAFFMIGSSKDIGGTLGGLMLITMSAFALPALIRLVTPAVSAVAASGVAAGMAGAAGAASIAMSAGTGAVPVMAGAAASGMQKVGGVTPASGEGASGQAPTGSNPTPQGAGASGSGSGSGTSGMGMAAAQQGAQAMARLTEKVTHDEQPSKADA
jgi:hypothetical protein